MAENTLTGLIPEIYEALDIVSRELTGMIPSATLNASANTAAVGQAIRVDIEPEGNGGDVTPAMVVPDPTGQTSGFTDIIITKSLALTVRLEPLLLERLTITLMHLTP